MKCSVCGCGSEAGADLCPACGALLPLHEPDPVDTILGQVAGGTLRFVREIGEGGLSRVYEGERQSNGERSRVAVKVLHEYINEPAAVGRFVREPVTVRSFDHPNIIRFFEPGRLTDGRPFSTMELFTGRSIAALLARQGPFSAERTVGVLVQLCNALDEVDRHGIVHNNVRSSTIFILPDRDCSETVKLSGFQNCEHFASDSIVSSREARGSAGECGVERARSGGARDGCRWRYGEFAGGGRAVGPRQQRS